MALTKERQRAWLNQSREEILDPAREIIDPHHHLWRTSGLPEYVLADLWEDTQSGHNIVKTVFMECGAEYRDSGPNHLKPVGETEFVRATASASAMHGKAEIAGIVAHAHLDMDVGLLKETLRAHEAAGDGLFKGIRHGGAHDPGKNLGWMNATPHTDLFSRDAFRRGGRKEETRKDHSAFGRVVENQHGVRSNHARAVVRTGPPAVRARARRRLRRDGEGQKTETEKAFRKRRRRRAPVRRRGFGGVRSEVEAVREPADPRADDGARLPAPGRAPQQMQAREV